MDLLAYAQIEEYENLLKNNRIEIPRLRGIDPCESMKTWTDEECEEVLNGFAIVPVKIYAQQNHFGVADQNIMNLVIGLII